MPTMSEAIREAFEQHPGPLSREDLRQFINDHYTGTWQAATFTAHLYACAINNPKAYVHHPHSQRFLYKNADGTFELYDEKRHGPNVWAPNQAEDQSEEAAQAVEASISLERDLEDQLVRQLDALEPGLEFENRQVPCDVGRVDIVGRGADGATVVVELKVGEAKDSAIGQIARYLGWYRQQGSATVRGILVASDFPEGVQYAATAVPGLALRRCRIKLSLEDAGLKG